ncbi:MAG: 2-oxo acid dehydrogenase subunit E2, partial [Erysipelotrichaceae bacterium]|nr:2-oxo acid dehydrogenase subunit E2 [Erysipelotrichaceae bacterium]
NRCDNEAFISETIDLTNVNRYLKKKNVKGIEYKYNVFQIITTALLKTITLRPKLQRFIVNGNFYQRREVTTSFVVKKQFADNGAEALAFLHIKGNDNIDTIHDMIHKEITTQRSEKIDSTTENMDILNKLPRFISKFAIHVIMWLDRHGWVPRSMTANDPYYSTVVMSNLGSIKMKSGYHHLTNWGTCSIICLIGEMKKRAVHNAKGEVKMVDTIDLGLTLDERLADGYYYARSIQLLKYLLQNPQLLERDMDEEVNYE